MGDLHGRPLASLVKGRGTAEGGGGIHYKIWKRNPPVTLRVTAPFDKGASQQPPLLGEVSARAIAQQ